ncbi:MAG: hypothetical protein C4536_12880 [Actinobacteria bacterium]|jgi:ACR3 family arsenite efflux pump ArsB|nr:MAG: hypothetical protein C4536_12880 [Actinomycetota bacterium]
MEATNTRGVSRGYYSVKKTPRQKYERAFSAVVTGLIIIGLILTIFSLLTIFGEMLRDDPGDNGGETIAITIGLSILIVGIMTKIINVLTRSKR